ncbi:MAG: hypothetical protein NTY48_05560 [Candidatus Diapherotrites archaeon]|nr:hypothetical protein [Candidatus Diapherotrites archaeon]
MSWEIIETPNAKYVLIFSAHQSLTEKVPTNFDALILESAGYNPNETIPMAQYTNLVAQAIKENKQIWLTDAGNTFRSDGRSVVGTVFVPALAVLNQVLANKYKNKQGRRKFLSAISIGMMTAWVSPSALTAYHGHSNGKTKNPQLMQAKTKALEAMLGKGALSIRNAITSEKTEIHIAPMLQRQIGHKPTIAMVWGAMHYGVKELLLHPEKRKKILAENELERWVKLSRRQFFGRFMPKRA